MSPPPKTAKKRPKRLTRAEKQAQTRARLIEAGEKVFRRRGFHGATVEEITAEAGFSRGAFYSNFSSREELFVELLEEPVYKLYQRLLEELPADLPPRERIRWGARALAEIHRDPDRRWSFELWLELMAYSARHPEFAELATRFLRDSRLVLAAAFSEDPLADEGHPAADPLAIATAVTALDIGLNLLNLVDPDEISLDLYEPLFDLLFGSLLAEQPEGA